MYKHIEKDEKKLTDGELVSTEWHNEQVMQLHNEIEELQTEIERLKEYNLNLNGMNLEFIDKNAELQKQVDEWNSAFIPTRARQQAIKDTAKEICDLILEHWEKKQFVECDWLRVAIAEKYGVEVE